MKKGNSTRNAEFAKKWGLPNVPIRTIKINPIFAMAAEMLDQARKDWNNPKPVVITIRGALWAAHYRGKLDTEPYITLYKNEERKFLRDLRLWFKSDNQEAFSFNWCLLITGLNKKFYLSLLKKH